MRSIAQQTVAELGGQDSLLVRQRRDHERLAGLLERLRASAAEADQAVVLNDVCRLVFTHAFAEESVVWPTVRRVLPDGEQLTLEVEREHQEITEVVSGLERSEAGSTERMVLIERAAALLDADVRDEEDELYPRLQEALTPEQLRRLGRQWELVRRIAPTRAHAVVSRRPPGNVLAALPLSAIDRTRDNLDRAMLRLPLAGGAARAASAALGKAAGVVERLPPLRRGEHPSTRPARTSLED